MACECDLKDGRSYYRYYDTPDGCDVEKKVLVASRYGVITGMILGSYDVLMYSHAVGLVPILKRYAFHVIPLGMMGATFALVANAVQRARQEDDRLNYFLGGFACGPIAAVYLRSKHAVLLGGLALGVAGMIKKGAIDNNITIFPEIPRPMNMIDSWRYDSTLTKDPKDDMIHTCGRK